MKMNVDNIMSGFEAVGNFAIKELSLEKNFGGDNIVVIKPSLVEFSHLIEEAQAVKFSDGALLFDTTEVSSTTAITMVYDKGTYSKINLAVPNITFSDEKGIKRTISQVLLKYFPEFAKMCLLAETKNVHKAMRSPAPQVVYIQEDTKDFNIPEYIVKIVGDITEEVYSNKRVLNLESSISFSKTTEIFYSTQGSKIVQYFNNLVISFSVTYINNRQNEIDFNVIENIDSNNIPKDLKEFLLNKIYKDISNVNNYVDLPSGEYNVLLDPTATNVFFHEAMGAHLLSGTYITEQISTVFRDRLGFFIDSLDGIDIIMDPHLEGGIGSYKYDHEGVESQKVTLMKDGVIQGYLHDRYSTAQFEIEQKDTALLEQLLELENLEELLLEFVPKSKLTREFDTLYEQVSYLLEENTLGELIESVDVDQSLNWRSDFSKLKTYSNGHCRVQSWLLPNEIGELKPVAREARMSNIIVKNNNDLGGVTCSDYMGITCSETNTDFYLKVTAFAGEVNVESGLFTIYPSVVKKVYLDGRPEENVDPGKLSISLESFFACIEYVGDDYELNHGSCGADSGFVSVSSYTPSMVVRDMPYQSAEKKKPVDDLIIEMLAKKL